MMENKFCQVPEGLRSANAEMEKAIELVSEASMFEMTKIPTQQKNCSWDLI